MSYGLDITPEAEGDLARLIDSLQPDRRSAAFDAVLQSLRALAANPGLATRTRFDRPTYRFSFTAGGVRYRWVASFRYSKDESRVVITQLYRLKL